MNALLTNKNKPEKRRKTDLLKRKDWLKRHLRHRKRLNEKLRRNTIQKKKKLTHMLNEILID
jgi:hypothetical protein